MGDSTLAERLYEGMFLMDSGQFAADPDGMTQVVTNLVERAGGTLVAHHPWQDGRLAFDIEGRRKGLHYLTYFRMDAEQVETLDRACRLNDNILRHLVIQQHPTLFEAMVEALTGQQHAVEQDEEAADDDGAGSGGDEDEEE